MRPAAAVDAVAAADPVYLPHPDRLPLFAGRSGEVRVVVEEASGRAAPRGAARGGSVREGRAGRHRSSGFRRRPTTCTGCAGSPTPAEEKTLAKIDAGEIVGYRGNLRPYVSTAKRRDGAGEGRLGGRGAALRDAD